MKDQLISFHTAELAKEAGYNWTERFELQYNFRGDIVNLEYELSPDINYPCTDQSLLQKWLRDVHGIQILIEYYDSVKRYDVYVTKGVKVVYSILDRDDYYKSYEKALEKALQKSLESVINANRD